jgi:hypothetical protein
MNGIELEKNGKNLQNSILLIDFDINQVFLLKFLDFVVFLKGG